MQSEITNARGQERTYTYDLAGRMTGYTSPEGNANYTYDANGNVLTATDSNGTITRTYDACNRVTSYTDVNQNTITYTYDAVGNLSSIKYPDQTVVTYTYDAANRLIQVTDWNQRVTTYTYDATGNLTQTVRPDGSILTQTYDAEGRLLTMIDKKSNGTKISEYSYTYNAKGLLTTETANVDGIAYTMTYDSLGRVLTRVEEILSTHTTKTETYTYDAAGNITSFTSGNESGTMGYDSKNRLTSYKGTAITYDADGNMSVGVLGTAAASFQYDSANRLTSATGTTYQYDNEGNRIQSQTSEQTLTYVYDTTGSMSRMLMSKTQGGTITKYIYGNGLIAQENSSGYYSYHYDLRGSTIALTNASGTVTNTYAYDTYGTVTKKTGTLTVLFLYNGRDGVVTDSNGLLYMRARYYSPQLKRFINADVVIGSIQESPTLNRYAYVNGNPISYVDPFGLSAEPGSNWVDTGHMVLDILGLLPVVGGIFDGTNVIWYLLAGDLVNAGFSATAFLPIIGDAAGEGKLIHNAGSKVGSQTAELLAKYGDDVAKWADDVLGFAKKEGLEVALPDGGSIKLWGDSSGNVVKFETEKVSQKNAYKTINEYKAKVNVGQQNKHIPGTNEYKTVLNNGQTKSIIYGDSSDVQKLLNNSAGTGTFIANNKERVDFEKIIGQYIDPDTGIKVETTVGIIHYGKKGAHIVPARPH